MTAANRLLQLHGVIVDLIYRVEALPRAGGEAIVHGFDVAAGGGFNAMVSARRSGMEVTYAGAVGNGPFGEIVIAALDAEGIEWVRPRSKDRDQGCCTVMLEPSGERTFVAADGAEGHIDDIDLARLDLPKFGWSLISGYTLFYENSRDAMLRWLRHCPDVPRLIFDPSPLIGSIPAEAVDAALKRAFWVSANLAEAALLTGASDAESAARRLAANRPDGGGAVVRCGADGCVVACNGNAVAVPAHRVDVVDTNGAGDTHLGAFVAALAHGKPPAMAALYANVAAALSATRYGPSTAPELETVEQTLRSKRAVRQTCIT